MIRVCCHSCLSSGPGHKSILLHLFGYSRLNLLRRRTMLEKIWEAFFRAIHVGSTTRRLFRFWWNHIAERWRWLSRQTRNPFPRFSLRVNQIEIQGIYLIILW